ncbi:MAG: hypothetical protein M5U01_23225 [Ardenticatenaceae bacterium]|nr:hypothetical protein [Ardenticatenaceae bacterium]
MLPDSLSRLDYGAKSHRVRDLLEENYGRPEAAAGGREPIDALVRAIIGQNTSHPNQERALARLHARFPDWELLAAAPLADVVACLHPAGLANQKAPRLQALIAQILDERGSLDLRFLATMEVGEAQAWLRALPGVGPLTAALVLLFALRRPALPVNTGLHRLAGRLGLLPPGVGPERASELLHSALTPAPGEAPSFEEVYAFHINMVRHADRVCRPGRPRCGECVLAHVCEFVHGGRVDRGQRERDGG